MEKIWWSSAGGKINDDMGQVLSVVPHINQVFIGLFPAGCQCLSTTTPVLFYDSDLFLLDKSVQEFPGYELLYNPCSVKCKAE